MYSPHTNKTWNKQDENGLAKSHLVMLSSTQVTNIICCQRSCAYISCWETSRDAIVCLNYCQYRNKICGVRTIKDNAKSC